jgi:AraC-like DNA-binding protein
MAERPVIDASSPRPGRALPADVARVVGWARGHLGEVVGLDDLARVAGVPPRTLEAHFRQFLGTTPLAWLRDARLTRVHDVLARSGARTGSVSQVALEHGFTQLGRFAAAYCRRFGELPSETLRKLRRARPDAFEDGDDEATRLAWRALPAAFAVAPGPCSQALEDLEQARALAPSYALPRAIAAWCYAQRAAQHFAPTPGEDSARALALAAEACRLAPTDSLTLTLASGAFTLTHRLAEADRLLDRALALEPTSPWAWLRRAWGSAYAGDAEAALRQFSTTLHFMPFEPVRHLACIGMGAAHFVAGRYGRAACWVQAGVELSPDSYWAARVLVAAAVHAGAREDGRRLARALLRRDPSLTVAVAHRAWPFPRTVMDRLAEGLASAGLPRD